MADDLSTNLADAARLLAEADDVTLLAHINPDADTLGSALAVGLVLHRRGVRVRVSFGEPDVVPESLLSLDFAGLLVPPSEVPAAPPLLVVMDTGSLGRLGPLGDRVQGTIDAGGQVIVVDHHVSNTRYGTLHVIDEKAEATALIALRLLDELDVELDEPVARCLYAGVATDTGSFRHAGPAVHEVAARLLATGVDAESVLRPLMFEHPFAYLGMLSKVLGRAGLDRDAAGGLGLAHAVVTLEDARGLRSEEVESVVDVVRSVREAEVAAVFKELRPGFWSVSLRAVSRVDVRHVAQRLGGGGHRLASGFTFEGTSEQLLAELRKALES
ncbi:bifunctional oligoribonuclease/PAP phosphatase NrnA [Lentzea tibetensis]|uniref:Bifunctional oligoribonuclease/PAP phosphatase NrnA n=1 Tax=Lentzea tibetensis TaxID=2591470 RepID=A0A563ER72_9PSEU|nr:bifunctional oligoribonuclease/PAP phosphatase NrnA [Lentzea tibetensis]TWP50176.1 bifunctional oligoribonuclease/PAP phosphatase NrnA [Lentzea tibetensis]